MSNQEEYKANRPSCLLEITVWIFCKERVVEFFVFFSSCFCMGLESDIFCPWQLLGEKRVCCPCLLILVRPLENNYCVTKFLAVVCSFLPLSVGSVSLYCTFEFVSSYVLFG
jgi:hypothetical protein